jgi:hypothetical protein
VDLDAGRTVKVFVYGIQMYAPARLQFTASVV